MILRKYQRRAVANCVTALKKHNNTLLVAATGGGKTIMLSAVIDSVIKGGGRAMVVQHRDVLVDQNAKTFKKMFPKTKISFVNAKKKDYTGVITFAMVQTLARLKNINAMQAVDLIVYDEAHHAASDSYRQITERARKLNPNVKILGVTATPSRSDGRGLKQTFNNVAEVISIGELVRSGYLVRPHGMVIDIGTQKSLNAIKQTSKDFDMHAVEQIQNTRVLNQRIISEWSKIAGDRPTVAFCATIQHAEDVKDSFTSAGYKAEVISNKTAKKEKKRILKEFDTGKINAIVNPQILTEGWDSQVCSCVMLLRPSSHKSTMIQMVGRGLRKVDPMRYPNIVKQDCKILDFGISLLMHGNLDSDINIKFDRQEKEVISTKFCPKCEAELPLNAQVCGICGYEFKTIAQVDNGTFDELEEFRLVEIDLLNDSPFKWVSLFPSGKVLMVCGFGVWAVVASTDSKTWFSIGGGYRLKPATLSVGNKISGLSSADDFMRARSDSKSAKKASRWMAEPATGKQLNLLSNMGCGWRGMTKVEAAALITFKINQKEIEKLLSV